MSEICVWESKSGWKIVEVWDQWKCPYAKYIVLMDGLEWYDAACMAKCLRKSTGLA